MTLPLNELLGLGLAILFGLLGGKLVKRFGIPSVTGYILAGLIIGPHVLGMLTQEVTGNLGVINEIALGLILFAIGNEFEWSHLKHVGVKSLLKLAFFEAGGVLILVTGVFLLLGNPIEFSLLAGTVAVATAPAVTLLVVREYRAQGPVTERLLALLAVNNVIALGLMRGVRALVALDHGGELFAVMITPFYELIVSLALGFILGKLLSIWEDHLDELSELLLVIIGIILVGYGLSKILMLSPMLVALAAGATVSNSSHLHRLIYVEQRQLEKPIYIAFFVLAGSKLHLDALPQMGLAGVAFVIARVTGKIGGIWLAGRSMPNLPQVGKYMGMTLLCQGAVAIGMAYEIARDFPAMGEALLTIILASVVVHESVGPLIVRFALGKADEIPKKGAPQIETDLPRLDSTS